MGTSKKVHLNDEMMTTLISAVKVRGCLWNVEDENYNDRYHVLSSWREIAKMLDVSEDVVKIKWKNLRDFFRREVRKSNPKSLEDYQGKWKHFKSLWFLWKPDEYKSPDHDYNEQEDNQQDEEYNGLPEHFVKIESPERSNDVEVYYDDPDSESNDPIGAKRKRYSDDDYDLMYLKSLTPYFRQLEPMRKLVLRSKIQDMLMNEIAAQYATTKVNNPKS